MIQFVNIILAVTCLALLLIALYFLKRAYSIYRFLVKRVATEERVKKIRKRYVVFATVCEEKVSYEEVSNTLRNAFMKLYGEVITQKASPKVLIFDEEKQRGIARVSHLYVDFFIASLGFVKEIGNHRCILIPLKVTGTIKKARKYLDMLKL